MNLSSLFIVVLKPISIRNSISSSRSTILFFALEIDLETPVPDTLKRIPPLYRDKRPGEVWRGFLSISCHLLVLLICIANQLLPGQKRTCDIHFLKKLVCKITSYPYIDVRKVLAGIPKIKHKIFLFFCFCVAQSFWVTYSFSTCYFLLEKLISARVLFSVESFLTSCIYVEDCLEHLYADRFI